ncbi:SDR family NAD(P)-dependent oxidoreductase [Amycolatopsis magusensis]|uniref:NAD(P)-dependent dehydrogenase (Short-subunit alcohol dehydrogenase family) n=1 Tax=Amycolatopsis magusensis TaxID=882444 RepID=A0ABS4Q161_9PSEU|nr:SDR family NAD(P)-dependent oxidoreductase [Amycolatopsis magusensis]MBP2185415.1 NAD(P)-dependent dehydrogenase (short-subunit alcohol dehydrogenase family) [Amycolatopsis magusensis]
MNVIVITGASDGIGAAASELLSSDDTRLILTGRSPVKTKAVAERVGAEYHVADFERLDEVRDLATALLDSCDRIDVLANNAGGLFSGPTRTVDGFEKTFQVNHLAPYLLTNLLIDRLLPSRATVVNTSSVGARLNGRIDLEDLNGWKKFTVNRAYGTAKLANILFTKGLHQRFHAHGLSSVAFHPGPIASNFASDTTSYLRWVYRGPLKRLLTSPERGGENLAHFATAATDAPWVSGEYYNERRKIARTNKQAYDAEMVARHWDLSAQMLGVQWPHETA